MYGLDGDSRDVHEICDSHMILARVDACGVDACDAGMANGSIHAVRRAA